MKRVLLPLLMFSVGVNFAQNVKDQNVAFKYTQNPLKPIDADTYFIELDNSAYEMANDDSMAVYEAKLDLAESQMEAWFAQKEKIDKAHLLEMSKWQKAVNGGVAAVQPQPPVYPEMPKLKSEIPLPIMTEEIQLNTAESRIALAGFSKGSSGAKITIKILGIQNAKITNKVEGTGAATKYKYTATYSMPAMVTIENDGQGIVFNETINAGNKSKPVGNGTYTTTYDYEYWKIDNLETFWKTLQQNEVNALMATINTRINNQCGFPVKSVGTELYTVKSYKEFDYSDLIEAFTYGKQGLDLVNSDRSAANEKLGNAVAIWKTALEESTPEIKKSRVNEKVTALLYVNVARALLWMEEFDEADTYIQKAKLAGVGKYKREAQGMEPFLNDTKNRYRAVNN